MNPNANHGYVQYHHSQQQQQHQQQLHLQHQQQRTFAAHHYGNMQHSAAQYAAHRMMAPKPTSTQTTNMLTQNNFPIPLPAIKTEIKTEPADLYGSSSGSAGNSASSSARHQEYQRQQQMMSSFADYTNDSYASSSHNSSMASPISHNSSSMSQEFAAVRRTSSSTSHDISASPSSTASNYGNMFEPTHGSAMDQQSRNTPAISGAEDSVCCVPLCGVRKSTSPTLHFFPFPKDEKYLLQWLHNLKMYPNSHTNYRALRICSLHFPKRCINRYSLCYWAVPTFNLGHDDVANLYQNREISNTYGMGETASCSMPNCPNQRNECNIKFYNFPKDTKTMIKWCQNARLPVQSKEPRHLCSRHFEERCFGKFRLKPWAVPTLHLGNPYGKIHDNPGMLYLEEKKCCLPHCRRTRSQDVNLSLYRFPRDEVLLQRWCYNLRLDPNIYRGKNHKICSAHFVKEALGLRKLSPGECFKFFISYVLSKQT